MARTPTNFFTSERRAVLEDLTGQLSDTDLLILHTIGQYSATKLWPMEVYKAINDPDNGRDTTRPLTADNGHVAFRNAIKPLIDPEQIGFRGCFLPEEAGCAGVAVPVYMMGLEMIAQGNASVALSLLIDGSILNSIWKLGDEKQKERYVRDALRDKKMTAFAQTEPGHGSDAGNLETRAILDGNHYVLNGQKSWNTNGGWADYYFVIVRTHPDRMRGPNGLSIIMVHRDEISDIRQIQKYSVPGSYNAELFFNDARVPVEEDNVKRMIGEKDRGFASTKELLTGGRVTVAAYGLGIATEAFEDALDYSRERVSQGEPLFEKQAIRLPLGECKAQIDAARLSTYSAAKRMQEGRLGAEASEAKLLANDIALRMALFNMSVHGAYGTAKEYRAHQLFDDVWGGFVGEGTAEVQKILIAHAIRHS